MTNDEFGRRRDEDGALAGAGTGSAGSAGSPGSPGWAGSAGSAGSTGSTGSHPVVISGSGGVPGDGPSDDLSLPDGRDEPSAPEHGRIGYGRYARFTPAALAALLVLGLGLVGLARNGPADEGPTIRPPTLEERLAPEATVRLLDGSRLPLANLRGSVVVLNFWASFCAPCKIEAPALQALHEEATGADQAVAVVGVGVRQEPDADARAFVRDLGLTYAIGRDNDTEAPGNGPIEQAFGVTVLPTTIVIRPDGIVDRFHIGQMSEEQLRFAVEEARAADSAA